MERKQIESWLKDHEISKSTTLTYEGLLDVLEWFLDYVNAEFRRILKFREAEMELVYHALSTKFEPVDIELPSYKYIGDRVISEDDSREGNIILIALEHCRIKSELGFDWDKEEERWKRRKE